MEGDRAQHLLQLTPALCFLAAKQQPCPSSMPFPQAASTLKPVNTGLNLGMPRAKTQLSSFSCLPVLGPRDGKLAQLAGKEQGPADFETRPGYTASGWQSWDLHPAHPKQTPDPSHQVGLGARAKTTVLKWKLRAILRLSSKFDPLRTVRLKPLYCGMLGLLSPKKTSANKVGKQKRCCFTFLPPQHDQ